MLQIIGLTDTTIRELNHILMESQTSIELKEAALDLFLQSSSPEPDVLTHVFNEYRAFRTQIAPFLTLGMLYDVLQDSAGKLSEYTTNLERFYGRLSTVLKQGDSIAEMHWIAQHLLYWMKNTEQRQQHISQCCSRISMKI